MKICLVRSPESRSGWANAGGKNVGFDGYPHFMQLPSIVVVIATLRRWIKNEVQR